MKHFFSLWRGCPVALLVLLWLAGPAVWAQAPAWQMPVTPVHGSGATSSFGTVVMDATGNGYVTGSFTGTVTLGATTLTSAGGTDIVIAKYNNSGFVWAQRIGGTGNELPSTVAVSGTSIYLAGAFYSPAVTIGSNTLNRISAGSYDSFVAKLTDTGGTVAFPWVQQLGDASAILATSGTALYISGALRSTTLTLGNTTLTANSGDPAFVAKLTDGGNSSSYAWARLVASQGGAAFVQLAVSGANVYLLGSFRGTLVIGNTTLTAVGSYDVFVAKLVDAGSTSSYAWVQQAGGTGQELDFAIAARGSSVYIAGTFNGPTTSFGNLTATSAGREDVFVAKLTDAGNSAAFTWALSAGGAGVDTPFNLAVSGSNVYVAGSIGSVSTSFGSTTLSNSTNSLEGFLARITEAGNSAGFTWAKQFGGAGNDTANGVAINGNAVYVYGYIFPPATFDSYTVASSAGNPSAFLTSLTDPTLTATTAPQGSLSFSLAPNPARSAAFVQLPGGATALLTLTDVLGRTMRTQTAMPGARVELDLHGLAPGLYTVQVSAGGTHGAQRLVVE
ncbi:T9SS type A sorting domain-containing protein [Hymenobacter properus]|uniref:T9SS type A sorting domain-containing protein n=1 Tax=Hymenobacter properus TaxID=2791026 RepID=A0A931BLW2_9BACT|nr:T9SS type A sorting domain-containing protein [Hymenobacter properus]MBF9142653.1 T9SS type A sorting domain-containing protein [Hymenobacter properus]MBR7721461.1 T9SS type A sorting domain-containing protein [Microvirga sp. SRT04]